MTMTSKTKPTSAALIGEVTESATKQPKRSIYMAAEAALDRARGAIESADPINDGYLRGFAELNTAIDGLPASLSQSARESWERLALKLMKNPLNLRVQSWIHRDAIADVYRAAAAAMEEARKAAPEPSK